MSFDYHNYLVQMVFDQEMRENCKKKAPSLELDRDKTIQASKTKTISNGVNENNNGPDKTEDILSKRAVNSSLRDLLYTSYAPSNAWRNTIPCGWKGYMPVSFHERNLASKNNEGPSSTSSESEEIPSSSSSSSSLSESSTESKEAQKPKVNVPQNSNDLLFRPSVPLQNYKQHAEKLYELLTDLKVIQDQIKGSVLSSSSSEEEEGTKDKEPPEEHTLEISLDSEGEMEPVALNDDDSFFGEEKDLSGGTMSPAH